MIGRSAQPGCRRLVWSAAAVGLCAPAASAGSGGPAWWPSVDNWAWWALAASLLVGTIVLLVLRAVGYGRLRKLWQALALSLLAHVALTAGTSLVAISQPMLVLLIDGQPDEPSVNLVIGQEAHLRTQVRYQITELPVADPSLAALMRAAPQEVQPPPFEPVDLDVPLVEPHRADLSAEPTVTSVTPPAVDDRVSLRLPGSDVTVPEAVAGRHQPVTQAEPPPTPTVQRPVAMQQRMHEPQATAATWHQTPLSAPEQTWRPESIAVAAAPQTSPLPAPAEIPPTVRPLADAPTVHTPYVTEPMRREETRPEPRDLSVAAAQPRRATNAQATTGRPAELAWPHQLRAADPLGATLTGHLNATLRPPMATNLMIEPVRPTAVISQLGRLGIDKLEVTETLSHRQGDTRKELVLKMGGSTVTESAVARALAWLVRNQEPDGRWTFIDEDADLPPGRRPKSNDDTGLTGLAVLCLLGANHRPGYLTEHRVPVTRGLEYLVAAQKADGDLRGDGDGRPIRRADGSRRGGRDMYSHGIATLALGEAAAMAEDARYGRAAARGAEFIVRSRNRMTGGWRYDPGESGDTSVLGWQVMALHSVTRFGKKIPPATRAGVMRWLASVSRSPQGMLAGYQSPSATQAMTAEGLFVRVLLGQRLTPAQQAEVIVYLKPPSPTEPPNYYGWYYGSLALMQLRGLAWRRWNASVRQRLTIAQHRGGKLDGSWDPSDSRWGTERGGRVYTTTMAALTLEVYYRYLPMLTGEENVRHRPAMGGESHRVD